MDDSKTKQMELVIDSRETKILQIIEANPQLLSSYKYKKEYLDLADFILSDAKGQTLFFERKTWADLASSLKDGRFREQRSRLLQLQEDSSTVDTSKICYIVEGLYDEKEYKKEKHALLRLQFVYSIPVFYSQSLMNTIEILREFLEKEKLDAFFSEGRDPLLDQMEARAKGKKRNYDDAHLFFGECLTTIKGLSGPMAVAITGKWSTLNDFMKDSEWETALKEEITYRTAKGNEKHISDKVIEKIRVNFFGRCSE